MTSETDTYTDDDLASSIPPHTRATINQLSVEQLDRELERIRAERLVRVQQLETIARVKADETRLVVYLKFEREYKRVQKQLATLDEAIAKVDGAMHKVRVLALECGL